jgi:simple sugar transport system substrate-binding protein
MRQSRFRAGQEEKMNQINGQKKRRKHLLTNFIVALVMILAACGTGTKGQPAIQTPTAWPTFTPLAVKTTTSLPAPILITPVSFPSVRQQPETATPAANPSKTSFHFILVQHASCAWDEFWCPVEEGIQDAARDMHVTVTILSPDNLDLKTTAAQIDSAAAAKPDGIALTVSDPDILRDSISHVIASGIPVIAYNAGAGSIKDALPYLTYVGMDSYQAGYQGASRLINAGARAGVCIIHAPDVTILQDRCEGFQKAFTEKGLKADVLNSTSEPVQAEKDIQAFAKSHPDVNAYFTTGPASATPFYAYLKISGRKPGELLHGAFDLSPEINANIENGATLFALDQQPYLQGYETVFWLTMINRYGFKPALPVTATGPRFVEKSNLNIITDINRPVKLILIHHGLCSWDPYWCVLDRGANDAARDMNAQAVIMGTDSFDLPKMASLVVEAVSAAPDGIGVAVPDANILHAPIMRAIQADIPVVAFDSGFGPIKDNLPYLTFIGQLEYESGYLGALRLINAGGSAGVCAIQQKGQTVLEARCKGFMDAFNTKGLKADELDIGGDPAKALKIVKDYAAAHPEVNVFLTLGGYNPGAVTIYDYIKESGRKPGEILHGTFDLSPEVVAAIESGATLFTVDAQPYLQGYSTVMFLTLYLRRGIVPVLPITATGPAFIDKTNVDFIKQQAGRTR